MERVESAGDSCSSLQRRNPLGLLSFFFAAGSESTGACFCSGEYSAGHELACASAEQLQGLSSVVLEGKLIIQV